MNQWINYHHLYYFKTIAEEGSVSRAAEKLRLGQPTLSAQLKQFEDNLGVKLFDRQHKKLILTEHGKVALDYSKNIFKLGSEMFEVLNDRLKPLKPSLHLGALDSVPKHIVLSLVQHAFSIEPCQITLSEGKSDELLRELTAHRIDLVVTNFLPSGLDGRGLFPMSIGKSNVSFYGSPKFLKLKKGFPNSISGQPLILPTYDSRLRQEIDHWAKLNKIELNIVVESQDISVKELLAENGIGIFPAATNSLKRQIAQKELVELGQLRDVSQELFLVTAHRKIENPIASRLRVAFNSRSSSSRS